MGTFSIGGGNGGIGSGGFGGLSGIGGLAGNSIGGGQGQEKPKPSFTFIDPPDDRYFPGYSKVDENGNTTNVGPRLKDLSVSYALYGLPIPISHGIRRLPGNIIWAVPLTENKVKKKKSGGGKGGGGPWTKNITFQYTASFAVSFGKSDSTTVSRQIIRIWGDGNLISDRQQNRKGKTIGGLNYRFYPGSYTQTVDPLIEADLGVNGTPAYRNLMYVVIEDLPVGQFGNRLPAITAEIGDQTGPAVSELDFACPFTGGGVSTSDATVDWLTRTAWTRADFVDKNKIFEVNIDVGWTRTLTITDPLGLSDCKIGANMVYIPWLNLLAAVDDKIASASQAIYLIEPASGAIVGRIFYAGSLGSNFQLASVSQIQGLIPVQVDGDKGTETFLLINSSNPFLGGAQYMTAVRLLPPSVAGTGVSYRRMYEDVAGPLVPRGSGLLYWGGEIVSSSKFIPGREMRGMCPGPLGSGYTDCFFVDDNGSLGRYRVGTYDGKSPLSYIQISPSTIQGPGPIVYYAPEDVILVTETNGTNTTISKFGPQGGPRIANSSIATTLFNQSISGGSYWKGFWQQDLSLGTISLPGRATGNTICEVEISSLSARVFNIGAISGWGGVWFHDSIERSQIRFNATGLKWSKVFYDGLQAGRTTLAEAIKTIALMAGLDPLTDISIAPEINDAVDGIYITERTSFRDLLDRIATVYCLDIVESNGVIKVTRKAQSLTSANYDFDISENELIEGNDGAVMKTRRENEFTLPRIIEFTYLSRRLSYVNTVMRAQRSNYPNPTSTSESTLSIQLPLIIQDNEAKALCYKMLYQGAWASRVTYQFSLPWKYTYLDPGDVGVVDTGVNTYLIKIKEMSMNPNWTINVKAQGFISDEPFAIDADGGRAYEQEIAVFSWPKVLAVDIPLVLSGLDTASPGNLSTYYAVVYPVSTSNKWMGAYAEISTNGADWQEIAQNYDIPMVATIVTPASNTRPVMSILDDESFIIKPLTGATADLVTVTDDQFLAGANAAVIWNGQYGEVLQFRDVTDLGNGTYKLSYLIRGQRNSDVFAAYQDGRNPMQLGASFFLLDPNNVVADSLPVSSKGTSYRVRAVNFNRPASENALTTFLFQARGTSNPAPINPDVAWQGTPGASNLRVTFSAVPRYENQWTDDVATEFFDDTVLDGADFTLRLYATSAYSAVAQTLNSNPCPIDGNNRYYIEITTAQLSSVYGTARPGYIFVDMFRSNSRGSTLYLDPRRYTIPVP